MSTIELPVSAPSSAGRPHQRSRRQVMARVWLATCLIAALMTAAWGYISPTQPKLVSTRIDQMQVGQWVLAGNPSGDQDTEFGSEVDPTTWRMLHLAATKTDSSTADVWMLRPLEWLQEHEAKVHGEIEISVPECGIDGLARVLMIGECPQISARPGPQYQVVTATFKHHGAQVIDLQIEGLAAPIGTTPNHPFWSEDHQIFVRADELTIGEKLRQADGSLTSVVSLTSRPGTHDVFNLEVQVDHTYHVGKNGVLVHNGSAQDCWKFAKSFQKKNGGTIVELLPKRSQFIGQLPNDPRAQMFNHRFVTKAGKIFDSANPNGVAAKEWFDTYRRLNGFSSMDELRAFVSINIL